MPVDGRMEERADRQQFDGEKCGELRWIEHQLAPDKDGCQKREEHEVTRPHHPGGEFPGIGEERRFVDHRWRYSTVLPSRG